VQELPVRSAHRRNQSQGCGDRTCEAYACRRIRAVPRVTRDHEPEQREHDEFVNSFHELGRMRFEPHVDFRRKRGLVEEINRQVEAVEGEVAVAPPTRVVPGGL
jgi:hypothetical protein